AAAGRHADDDRASELARRTVAQSRRLRHDLVIGRIDVVGELHLDAGPEAIRRHADCRADNAEFADRRVEAAVAAILRLKPRRAAEHAAEIAYILAEDDNVVVPSHR